jgi:hypothetical protein
MASNSGWSTAVPSGQSRISNGDDEIRSVKSFMQAWWEQEHYATGGSAASAGVHRHGSARAFVGTTSQLSNPTGDNEGRLFFTSDNTGLRVASGGTWKPVTNAITLASSQTWTALQEFDGGIQASNLSVEGSFSGWISYSTFTDLASIASNNVTSWVATDGNASLASAGDFCIFNSSAKDAFTILTARASNGSISLNVANVGTLEVNPSAQTYTVMILKRGHLQ